MRSASYDEDGYITGTMDILNGPGSDAVLIRGRPGNREYTAPITGLIGEQGAVGVFVGALFGGGFVVTPSE